mmetsp:Transcript_7067/g.17576  ORF Transcript_7067/g.17576 Transcript_7067/m.17576 type:complete len:224 (+) Transcript_7067:381-1052(+)
MLKITLHARFHKVRVSRVASTDGLRQYVICMCQCIGDKQGQKECDRTRLCEGNIAGWRQYSPAVRCHFSSPCPGEECPVPSERGASCNVALPLPLSRLPASPPLVSACQVQHRGVGKSTCPLAIAAIQQSIPACPFFSSYYPQSPTPSPLKESAITRPPRPRLTPCVAYLSDFFFSLFQPLTAPAGARYFRPLARRALSTLRPVGVWRRARKPEVRARARRVP